MVLYMWFYMAGSQQSSWREFGYLLEGTFVLLTEDVLSSITYHHSRDDCEDKRRRLHTMVKAISSGTLALGLILMVLAGEAYGSGLKYGFYDCKCGSFNVEKFIFRMVSSQYRKNPEMAGAIIRMQFHDCWVRGCDASVLLDGKDTEKTSPPNLGMAGFEFIDAIKDTVEKFCPGLVSCADIIVLTTRAVIYLTGGKWYDVETGRRDGLVSIREEAFALPPPNAPVPAAIDAFAQKGFSVAELVYLLGGHTIGIAHCVNFQHRLYNYQNTGKPDPSMSPALRASLMKKCPPQGSTNSVFLDQHPNSQSTFDNGFYKAILAHKGVIEFDQRMATDPQTRDIVKGLATNRSDFLNKFNLAMAKLQRLDVLSGKQGEIRKSCRRVNSH